jgi:hypothetical protein
LSINNFVFDLQSLTLSRNQIAKKTVEVQPRSHIAELEEANVQLRVELAAASAKVTEF